MNPVYTSPEQRPEAPAAIDLRLRTIGYAGMFLEVAMLHYPIEESISAPHVPVETFIGIKPEAGISPEGGSSEHVAPVVSLHDNSQESRIKQAQQLVEKAQNNETTA